MTHRLLVLANGRQTRFGPADSPKQLLPLGGVPLLVGTVRRLWNAISFDSLKVLTGNSAIQDALPGMCWNPGETRGLQETMLASRQLWANWEGRTTFLFGDCYYSDAAIRTIAECNLSYAHICRTHHSEITGKPYGETFAMSWLSGENQRAAEALVANPEGTSWQFYRRMAGIEQLPDEANYLELSPECLIRIDDLTEDFDTFEDYQRWLVMRERLPEKLYPKQAPPAEGE